MRTVNVPETAGYVEDWQMSPGLHCGDFLFLTGMTAVGTDGTLPDSDEAQFRVVFDKIGAVLAEAGCGFGDVVEMTSYHIGLRAHIDLFREVRAEYVRQPYPAWTAVEVVGFASPGVVTEIKVIARVPKSSSETRED